MGKDVVKKAQGQVTPVTNWTPGEGFEDFEEEDRSYPRVTIAQMQSKAVVEGNVKQGHWYNVLTGEDYGEAIKFAILKLWKSRVYFKDGVAVCRSLDAKMSITGERCATCEYAKWSDDAPAACSLVYNFLTALEVEYNQANIIAPVVISLMRTSAKAGRQLFQTLNYLATRGEPIYGRWIEGKVKLQQNKKGNFYVPIFNIDGQTPDEFKKQAHALRAAIQGLSIKVEDEDDKSEAPF